jgi:DNA-binding protein HU-beta
MNKQALVDFVASEMGQSKKASREAVNVVIGGILEGLLNEGKVSLVGFGTFELVKKPARTARNPKTGESIEVPEKMVPKFRASRSLKDMAMDLEFEDVEEEVVAEEEVEEATE